VFVAKLSANGDSLLWSTFLGGSQTERSADIALAPDGGVIVAGETYSFDFPFTHDSQAYVDYGDAFVAKLSADGVSLVYSRLLGGSDWDGCHALAVNSVGEAFFVGGTASVDFPVTPGTYETDWAHGGAFVAKIHQSGEHLAWSTFVGTGTASDVVLGSQGRPVVVGRASSYFATTPGSYYHSPYGAEDSFALVMHDDGTDVVWSSRYGGSSLDAACSVALNSSGELIILNETYSSDFPTTDGAFDRSFNYGVTDMTVCKLSADGTTLMWSTYLGGGGEDIIPDPDLWPEVLVDQDDNIWLFGQTRSTNYPVTSDAMLAAYQGSWDLVVTSFHSLGGLRYSSYLGTTLADNARGVVLCAEAGGLMLYGMTLGSAAQGFPVTAGTIDPSYAGEGDGFILKLGIDVVPIYLRMFRVERAGATAVATCELGDPWRGARLELWRETAGGARVLLGEMRWAGATVMTGVDPDPPGGEALYWLREVAEAGGLGNWYGPAHLAVAELPAKLALAPAAPNPFNPRTIVRFELPRAGLTVLALYDQRGRRVRTLVDGFMDAGYQDAVWDGLSDNGSAMPSGVYFVRLETEAGVRTSKLTLAR